MKHTVLIVDDEPRFRELYANVLTLVGVDVVEAATAEEALEIIAQTPPSLIVSDLRMPGASGLDMLAVLRRQQQDLPFLLVTAHANVRDAVAALKLGAVDYLTKPVDLDELVACVQDALLITPDKHPDAPPPEATEGIVATGPVIQALLRDAWHIAKSEVGILLTGESGTGKEVLAKFIHRSSARAKKPFVPVNCGALPASMLSSELFGHEKGAFTGAQATRKGHFREADKGVLFLDEIGEIPLEIQPVFLRAIEQRTVRPVGATGEVEVDFRLITATNRSLEDDVTQGLFRADLFYRLNVIALHLPALRERSEDIIPLARHFLAQSGASNKRLARATIRLLQGYHWPGNVRELKHAMQRARLMSRSDTILPEHLPPGLLVNPVNDTKEDNIDEFQTLQEREIDSLRSALNLTQNNRTEAARLLGISRRGLLKKIKRFGI